MPIRQITLGLAAIVLSWYAMMTIHEAGHCLGALATNAKIEKVDIPLGGFSRTDVSDASHPAVVVWAGPIFGAVAPLGLLLLRHINRRAKHILMFFIGFCLLANGAYIGAGAFVHIGDAGDLLRLGLRLWLLVMFGVISCAGGLYAWHRMGPLSRWFK